ncbi:hypothetical protein MRX96_035942 [Rhipicephalus microplus]
MLGRLRTIRIPIVAMSVPSSCPLSGWRGAPAAGSALPRASALLEAVNGSSARYLALGRCGGICIHVNGGDQPAAGDARELYRPGTSRLQMPEQSGFGCWVSG